MLGAANTEHRLFIKIQRFTAEITYNLCFFFFLRFIASTAKFLPIYDTSFQDLLDNEGLLLDFRQDVISALSILTLVT